MIKKLIIPLFSLAAFILVTSIALAVPGTWAGYAHINNAVAVNGTPISAVINNASAITANTTIRGPEYSSSVPQGYYMLTFEANVGEKVNFRVCGVNFSAPSETWSTGPHYNGTTPNFNLSVSTLADGSACTYACGCTGGFCNSGTCANSAVTTTTTGGGSTGGTGGGSSGGGGAATTTTVKGTTPPVKESETVASIPANSTGKFSFETTPITEVNVEVKNAVTNAQLTITKTDTAPANVAIAAPGIVYAYFNIEKINVADANVNNVTIKFKVEKSWITDNNIDVGTITLNRYVNGTWIPLTTKLVSSNGYYYFEAESPGLSVFAVSAQQKPTTTIPPVTTTVPATTTTIPIVIKPGDYTWILVLVIIIVIFFVIWKYYKKIRKKAQAAISEIVPQQ